MTQETNLQNNINNLGHTEIIEFSRYLTHTCESIMLRCGPFLKEGVYQDILVHELLSNNIMACRELVFPYQFMDAQGNPIFIGNCQSLRSDIELPNFGGVLELKASSSAIKDENVWQLRNYLENRPDRNWGLVINFMSKFTQNSSCKVQLTLLIKTASNMAFTVSSSSEQNISISRYYKHNFESLEYPTPDNLFLNLEVNDTESPVEPDTNLTSSQV